MDVWWWWWHLPFLLMALGTTYSAPPDSPDQPQTTRAPGEMISLCHNFTNGNDDLYEFYSPNYPGEYLPNMSCHKVITAPEGHVVKVIFMDAFNVELSEGCQYDYLEIKDGNSGSAVELAPKLCGHEFPDFIQSTDRYIWLHFHSDREVGYTGFKVRYEFVRIETTKMPSVEGCRYTVEGYSGNISSEDINGSMILFTEETNAPLDCIWTIQVRDGWQVRLKFFLFKLQKPNECQNNFLHLYEQKEEVTDHIVKFCGTIAESKSSTSNAMQMRFFATKEALKSKFEVMFTAFRNKSKATENCTDDEFDCEDNTCISGALKCDGPKNCQHEWDESKCENKNVKSDFDLAKTSNLVILILTLLMGFGMLFAFGFQCVRKLRQDREDIQEEVRRSRELLEEGSVRVSAAASVPAPVPSQETLRTTGGGSMAKYTNGEVVLANSYSAGNAVDQEVTVYGDYEEDDEEEERCVEMRDNACQTRDSLWDTNWDGSTKESVASKPSSSSPAIPPRIPMGRRLSERPPIPTSQQAHHRPSLPTTSATTAPTEPRTFHAEAKIEVAPGQQRPCSLDSSKSAPDRSVTFTIEHDGKTRPLDRLFRYAPNTGVIPPKSKTDIKLSYKPRFPDMENHEFYKINCSTGNYFHVYLSGNCTGPQVESQDKVVRFGHNKDGCVTSRVIQLSNLSETPANFYFDVDPLYSAFRLEPTWGLIKPGKQQRIKVTFLGKKPHVYARKVVCLIHYQPPISFHFVYTNTKKLLLDRIVIPVHEIELPEQERFLQFGLCEKEKVAYVQLKVTNLSDNMVTLLWNTVPEHVFRVSPEAMSIPRMNSVEFEVSFKPHTSEMLYSSEIEGYVHRACKHCQCYQGRGDLCLCAACNLDSTGKLKSLPSCISFRAEGHSFRPGCEPWAPHFIMRPNEIWMPPMYPGSNSATTLLLSPKSDLPVMFNFQLPPDSPYTIKPLEGLVMGGPQVIVVNLQPKVSSETTVYLDRCRMQVNVVEENAIWFTIRGEVLLPFVDFGEKGMVLFDDTMVDSVRKIMVPVINTTRENVWFKVIHPVEDEEKDENYVAEKKKEEFTYVFSVSDLENQYFLKPNQRIFLEWVFQPAYAETYQQVRPLRVSFLSNPDATFLPTLMKPDCIHTQNVMVSLMGRGIKSDLIGDPKQMNMGYLTIGKEFTERLTVTNESDCDMAFFLEVTYLQPCETFDHQVVRADVVISPAEGKLAPGEWTPVMMTLRPTEVGTCHFQVSYRKVGGSLNPVTNFKFIGAIPYIQITDIVCDGSGIIIGRSRLWSLLELNRLNETWRKLQFPDNSMFDIKIPGAVEGTGDLHIKMRITNPTKVPAEWVMKVPRVRHERVENPYWYIPPLQQLSPEDNRIQTILKANIIEVGPGEGILQPSESVEAVIKYRFTHAGEHDVPLSFGVRHHNVINARLVGNTIPKTTPLVQVFTKEVNLYDVSIEDADPPIQIFWLFNPTHEEAPYKFLASSFKSRAKLDVVCCNPAGTVPALSWHPVKFRFRPMEEGAYMMMAPLQVNGQTMVTVFHGKATLYDIPREGEFRKQLTPRIPMNSDVCPVRLDPDQILVTTGVVPLVEHRIVYLTNTSKTSIMSFKWHPTSIRAVADITVVPPIGKLSPGQQISCKVMMTPGNTSSAFSAEVYCTLRDESAQLLYERQVELHLADIEMAKTEFTITKREHSEGRPIRFEYPGKPPYQSVVLTAWVSYTTRMYASLNYPLERLMKLPPPGDIPPKFNHAPKLSISLAEYSWYMQLMKMIIKDAVMDKAFVTEMDVEGCRPLPYYQQLHVTNLEAEAMKKQRKMSSTMISEVLESVLNKSVDHMACEGVREASRIHPTRNLEIFLEERDRFRKQKKTQPLGTKDLILPFTPDPY